MEWMAFILLFACNTVISNLIDYEPYSEQISWKHCETSHPSVSGTQAADVNCASQKTSRPKWRTFYLDEAKKSFKAAVIRSLIPPLAHVLKCHWAINQCSV